MKFIPNAVSMRAARTLLHTQKHSPQLLLVGGLTGMGATIVLACKATLKVDGILQQHEAKIASIETTLASLDHPEYTLDDAKHDKIHLTVKTGSKIVVLYGPAILTCALATSAIIGSHNILTRRNAALVVAYGTIKESYDNYRARVAEVVGHDREKEIYHDVQPCQIEDPETGKTVKRKVSNGKSMYARFFGPDSSEWSTVPESNEFFLRMQQQYANDRLQARGHMFLNEVYDALGMARSKEGSVVGWVKGRGDDYIDFGIFNNMMEEKVIEFMVGRERGIWLDFNVDGVIYDKI